MAGEIFTFIQKMSYADIVSTISLIIVSIVAFIQIRYSKTQNNLNRLLIEEKKNSLETKADISANLVRDGKHEKIRIYNKGNEGAKNVICKKVSSCKGWNFEKDTFEFLDEGKNFTIHTARGLPCDNRCTVSLLGKIQMVNMKKTGTDYQSKLERPSEASKTAHERKQETQESPQPDLEDRASSQASTPAYEKEKIVGNSKEKPEFSPIQQRWKEQAERQKADEQKRETEHNQEQEKKR